MFVLIALLTFGPSDDNESRYFNGKLNFLSISQSSFATLSAYAWPKLLP